MVDELNKNRGRPLTDRQFQLRFIIWWKIFASFAQQTAINRFNSSPELKMILKTPQNPYTRSSLRRFLKDLGEANMIKMTRRLLKKLIKRKAVDTSKGVLDFFPVYSFLNMQKCLRIPKFDKHFATEFFELLNPKKVETFFPQQHKKSAPLNDKLRVLIHQFIWGIPSDRLNYAYIFDKKSRSNILRLEKS